MQISLSPPPHRADAASHPDSSFCFTVPLAEPPARPNDAALTTVPEWQGVSWQGITAGWLAASAVG